VLFRDDTKQFSLQILIQIFDWKELLSPYIAKFIAQFYIVNVKRLKNGVMIPTKETLVQLV